MKSFNIEILNPKAQSILEGLVKLNLIRIKDIETTSKFSELLNKFRKNTGPLLSVDETIDVAKTVREINYAE